MKGINMFQFIISECILVIHGFIISWQKVGGDGGGGKFSDFRTKTQN
jgi:hypothetical protein